MKIIATVNVPDEEYCFGCDLWYRAENHRCYCLLFDMVELTERYKENMVSGTDIIKCDSCKKAATKEEQE